MQECTSVNHDRPEPMFSDVFLAPKFTLPTAVDLGLKIDRAKALSLVKSLVIVTFENMFKGCRMCPY